MTEEKPKPKRYLLCVVEEAVLNPEYQWGRGGRIEVYDQNSDLQYATAEHRFFIPEELFPAFRDAFDGKEVDHPVRIAMDWREEKPKCTRQYEEGHSFSCPRYVEKRFELVPPPKERTECNCACHLEPKKEGGYEHVSFCCSDPNGPVIPQCSWKDDNRTCSNGFPMRDHWQHCPGEIPIPQPTERSKPEERRI